MSKFNNEMSFRFLWIGQMLANLGDVLYTVSLTTMVYKVTKSVTFMSFVPFVITITALISGIVVPIIIDKYKLKSILFYSQFGKTIFLLFLWLLALHIKTEFLWLLYLLIAFISFLDGWASPARNALIPSLIKEEKLIKANSFLAISDQVTQLIAWPIGSLLLVLWGGSTILWFTFTLFVISSILMFLIADQTIRKNREKTSKLIAIKEGWQVIWNSKQLRTISVMNVIETLANGVWIAAILFIYVEQALQKTEVWWGFINAAFFGGMFIGGLLVYRYSTVLERKLGQTIMWSSFCLTTLTFLFGMTSLPWVALGISLLYGLPQMARDVAEVTIIQKNARQELLAKVYSARGTLIYAAFGTSSLLLGFITEHYGVRITFLLATILFLMSFLIAFVNRTELFQSEIPMKIKEGTAD
ncbi:MFS transporter [Priestia aryabhattai]|uniref:MFS transporter n=1 Tax=Priestia aryabhattai TaxID=412384 RepID=A0AAX6N2L3_PRIAR|nr:MULTISPECIES: MFS transporter [Priestia]MDU9690151.1 MFS transporter [Priestia aryabhattai]MED5244010.1 MFS transporter [Priestia sp. LL-8]